MTSSAGERWGAAWWSTARSGAAPLSSAGGTLRLAQAEVVQAAGEVDWDQLLAHEEQRTAAWQQARASVVAIMDPLMPSPLASLYPAPSPGF